MTVHSTTDVPIETTSLSTRLWQPTIILFFAADHTTAATADGVADYFEALAACNFSQSIDVILPRKDVRIPLICGDRSCARDSFRFSTADITIKRNESINLVPRLLRHLQLVTGDTAADMRHVHMLVNVRCNNTPFFPDMDINVDVPSLMQKNVTYQILWATTETNVDSCRLVTAISDVKMSWFDAPSHFKSSVPSNCNRRNAVGGHSVPSWAIAVIAVATILALTGGRFVAYRLRATSNSKEKNKTNVLSERSSAVPDPMRIPGKELSFLRSDRLGSGAFAEVFRGKLMRPDPTRAVDVAVKVARKTTITTGTSVWQEVELMRSLGYHDHILGLLGYVKSDDESLIVLEYCDNGDLLRYLRHEADLHRELTEPAAAADRRSELTRISWEISDGMVFLSSRKYIHRDLAARNVLLTADLVAKISDFGLCRYTDEEFYTAQTELLLPWKWMAPESLRDVEFSSRSDMWSFGIVLFEIFSGGTTPYSMVADQHELLRFLDAGNRLQMPSLASRDMQLLMDLCWDAEPKSRPTFFETRARISEIFKDGIKVTLTTWKAKILLEIMSKFGAELQHAIGDWRTNVFVSLRKNF